MQYTHHLHYLPDLNPTWRPPQQYLHYQELYHGIYEFLRATPSHIYHDRAVDYLMNLLACYHTTNVMQGHRILWTREWLDALQTQDEQDSDADTVTGE